MNPKRKSRLFMVLFLVLAIGGTTATLMLALEQDINMFYPPQDVVTGIAPKATTIRAGGMVLEGSVSREPNSLAVGFVLTDRQGAEFPVTFAGILPDLFREGQGVLVQGKIAQDGLFWADEVLAKHDENYMPPELVDLAAQQNEV